MKKLFTAVFFSLCLLFFSTAAIADAALPPPEYRLRELMENAIVPILIAVVIIAIGVLVKVLKSRKK